MFTIQAFFLLRLLFLTALWRRRVGFKVTVGLFTWDAVALSAHFVLLSRYWLQILWGWDEGKNADLLIGRLRVCPICTCIKQTHM
ncbi:hypothetical protein CgunFtcFv8_003746 [Champsocephalus gunnari]|uniref:Uncharacterized protein n=1 Tax=Champsocephalus gunnari TaxID=52237 RepID=A0AAN8DZ37_CHAGU|nr:hypothetical protein CgunFtcFv8_003746 [Champsocephalus gunnari]